MVYIKFSAFELHSGAETSSETITGLGHLIDGFALGQPWFSAGQGWSYKFRSCSVCPLSVVSSFFFNSQRLQNTTLSLSEYLSAYFSWKNRLTTLVKRADKTCKTDAKKSNILHRKNRIRLCSVECLLKLTEAWKNWKKPSNLVFLMFHFFPNLDWNPESLEGKCSKETLKLNERTKIKFFSQMCSNIV